MNLASTKQSRLLDVTVFQSVHLQFSVALTLSLHADLVKALHFAILV